MSTSTLEIVWQQNATAYVFRRGLDGTLGGADLGVGTPAAVRLTGVEPFDARRVDAAGLLALAAAPPLEPGGTARAAFALVELAQRAVTEGLVHPELGSRGSSWFAFWGSTLEETVDATLDEIAAALPPVAYDAFDDADEAVRDLYPVLVDRVARDRLRAAKVRLAPPAGPGRQGAPERLLEALAADEPDVASHGALPSLQRRLADWVDNGLGVLLDSGWHVALHLDELPGGALALQLWLHAQDDPTLSLPADLLWRGGGEDAFLFLRASDPRHDLLEQTAALAPLLEPFGIVFDEEEPDAVVLDDDDAGRFLRDAIPALQAQGVPVLLPRAWVRTPAKLRLDLTASSGPGSGLLGAAALARFEWRVAVGDTTLTEEQLRELAAAKEPVLRAAGRWHALQHSDVERALRFLERRRRGGGIIDLVRAVSGVEAAEAGLELGAVRLDAPLAELLHGGEEGGFRPLPTPAGMAFDLFPFQERGLGWLRLLGDLGVGAILADDMGLGKTVQAIALLVSEREDGAQPGPTLVVCPMSVVAQWASEVRRFAPGLRVHVHHGPARLAGAVLAARARSSDVVVTSYDIATRDIDDLTAVEWDRLLLDEAQDVKNPWTKRARALRRLSARRRLAMTGTPIENRLSELWALMDLLNPGLLGAREWFERSFARPIELHHDERALQRLRALVGPFVLRREKTGVDLELPPITVEKDYCRLTVEQASLYRATVDRWLPRIEEHSERFARRGAVLAMLGQLKQVCNHPELLLPTGRALEGRSGKLERLVELLQAVPDGDKSLVFTQYPGFSRLVPHLEQRLGRSVGFFHGGLHARARQELLASFAQPEGPQILVVSIRAGGRGLNLPAANHVFHFDRWWNPAVEQQATDRVYRLGQRKHVWVHSLICSGTLEERIDQLLDSKRELAESVISGGGDDWLGDLDLGAIRAAVALSPDWTEEAAA